jgi:dTDP-4-dehydrorhamnose reductase
MARILLTGASGFLGGNFCHFYGDKYEVHALFHRHPVIFPGIRSYSCDLQNQQQVSKLVKRIKPDAITHLAALSQPNDCARQPELSYKINVEASEYLAQLSAELGIPFLFTSTDLVFDGEEAPYGEYSIPEPANLYGKHKWEAEMRVGGANPDVFICRLPLMYGNSYSAGVSFLQPILENLKNGKTVNLFSDEYRTPASAHDVCEGLLLLLSDGEPGLYHLGGPERLSRVEMGEVIADVYGFSRELLVSCKREDVEMPAYRPKDTSLVSDDMKELGWTAGTMREELLKIKTQNNSDEE